MKDKTNQPVGRRLALLLPLAFLLLAGPLRAQTPSPLEEPSFEPSASAEEADFPLVPVDAEPHPSASTRVILHRYDYRRRLRGYDFQLELYLENQTKADKMAEAVFGHMQQKAKILATLQQQMIAAHQQRVTLSPEAYAILARLQDFCHWSKGAFDPTDAPLYPLWGFAPGSIQFRIPSQAELQKALKQVSCQALDLQRVPPTLYLTREGLTFNRNHYEPGWLLDQGAAELQAEQVPAARLQQGSLAYYHGAPPDAPAWKVPLPHPRPKQDGELYSYLYVRNQALAILGDYQNYFLHNGLRYSSLLDARNGQPHRATVAVYVLASGVLDAALLARSAAVLDEAETRALKKELGQASMLKLVEQNGLLLRQHY